MDKRSVDIGEKTSLIAGKEVAEAGELEEAALHCARHCVEQRVQMQLLLCKKSYQTLRASQ